MRTKSIHKPKINILTLGCSKNRVDSEVLLTQLEANQLDATHESNRKSDVVVINTCGFIDLAKEQSIQTILEYSEKKQAGEIKKLFVTGCLSERYRNDLQIEIPEVDAWFGTMELPALLNRLGADYKQELLGERRITTDSHFAFLKISEGCDRPCSFCAIPLMRGGHKSRTIESLVEEASFLVKRGVKELILIAQDLTYYGLDLYQKRNLAELLKQLSAIPQLEWIRLQYTFPAGFPEDILDVIQNTPNICKYLDIPLQHGSDAILKSMRRGITREKTRELLKTIREKVPGIALRTTFIVGYPGETEKDFQDLCDLVEEARFDRMGVFTYSHEENTHAYQLIDDVPEELKNDRAAHLMALQQDISLELNEAKIGSIQKVLIDRKEGAYYIARSQFDSPEVDNEILIEDSGLNIGDFYSVKIVNAEPFDLYGKLI